MILQYLDQIIGTVPQNYEPLRYLFAGLILIWFLNLVYRLFVSFFGGYRNK